MGRRKKRTGSRSTSQLDTNEAKLASNGRSRKGKNKKANIFLKDLPRIRPGALSDFRIEVRKTSTEDGKCSGYERLVSLRNKWSPVSSSTVKPNFTCANRTESSALISNRKLSSDGPSGSVSFSDNPKLKKHYSDYGRVQTSHGNASGTQSPDRRKSCETEIKPSALKSPKHQGNRGKSYEQYMQGSDLTGKKSFSAPPTPIRHLVLSGKGRMINRGDSRAWASHPYVSHFEGQGNLEQHTHCPQGQGGLLPGGLRVEQLKNALSELFQAAKLGEPMLEHQRIMQGRESVAGDTSSLPVPNWVRSTYVQGEHSRPVGSSYNCCEGGSLQSPNRMPFSDHTFGGHYGEGVPGLLQVVHGQRSPGQGDRMPMPNSCFCGRSPEFRGAHALGESLENEVFSHQKGGSRKRPGLPLPDQSRRQPCHDQERVGVSWMDQQGKSSMDQDRSNSSHYAGNSSPYQHQNKSLIGHKMNNYDSMQTHHDTIKLSESHSPKSQRHFGEMSREPFNLKNYGSAGASPTFGGKSNAVQRLEKATMVNKPIVRFRDSKSPIKRLNSSSPEAHQEEVSTGRYKWEYFGTESSNSGEEEQLQDAHSSFKSGMADFSSSTKFSPKFKASKSDVSIEQSATRMGPSTAMIGVQSTTAPSDTSDQYASIGRGVKGEHQSVGYGGGVGYTSFRGRGFIAPPGCRGSLPVTQLRGAGDGVKRNTSASSSLRDKPSSNLEALIRGNDNSLGEAVALDCEMVGAGKKGSCSMVGRVAVVNHNGHVLLDSMVAPTMPVTDYRTRFSGIRKRDLIGAPSFTSVQNKVVNLVKGRILVGHDIQNDLKVLNLTHPIKSIRDTSNYYFAPFRKIPDKSRSKLKTMFQLQTGDTYTIQTGEHCPVEDARATMMLYQLNKAEWEASLRDATT